MRALVFILSLLLLVAACAPLPSARAQPRDTPVPASEPRASLKLELDLEPASGCDERFDLVLYEDRGVELVTWPESANTGQKCGAQRVTIRYLPRRITRAALLSRIRGLSKKMEIIEG